MTASVPMLTDRRFAGWLLAAAVMVWLALALVLVPWGAGGNVSPALPDQVFTAEELAAAQAYTGSVRPAAWLATAVSVATLAVIGFTRMGPSLMARLPRRWWLAAPVGVLVLLLAQRMMTTPMALWTRSRRLEAGLTDQAAAEWWRDRALGLAVEWSMTVIVLLMLLGLARWSPRRWFLWAGAAGAGAVFAGSLLYPVVVEPLFNEFEPVPDKELSTAVLGLADDMGVDIQEVLVSDASRRTNTLNAYVSGLGDTRRVVLYDNLVDTAPRKEVLSVVAHELAHVRHNDVLVGTVLGAVGAVVGMAGLGLVMWPWRFRALRDARSARSSGTNLASASSGRSSTTKARSWTTDAGVVPWLVGVLALGGLLVQPVQNGVSRAIEARADRVALEATRDPETFMLMQRTLALRSLADPTPPRWSHFWFGSHPTVLQRIGMARAYEADR